MSDPLDDKQYIPLSRQERAELKAAAKERNMTPAVFARALYLMGLKRLGTKGGEDAIAAERQAADERVREGARNAARTRWENAGKTGGARDEG